MKLKHTAQFALSFNVKLVDDAGRDVSAYIMPVVYFWLWIPGWLWNHWGREDLRPSSRLAPMAPAMFKPLAWLFDLRGWQADLPVIALAAWLLARDPRSAFDLGASGRLADAAI